MNRKKPVLQLIPIEKLKRGKYQTRSHFDETALQELANSIKAEGLIQPIVVRPLAHEFYEIIAGERRWRASQLAGLDWVPCLVNYYSDEQAAAVTTIENVIRVDLNPIEEAKAYQQLVEDFDYLHDEVAAVIGCSRVKVTNTLRLLKLEARVQQLLIEDEISEGHCRVLLSLPAREQLNLAQQVIDGKWSVRQLERAIKKAMIQNDKSHCAHEIIQLERSLSEHVGCPVSVEYDEHGKGSLRVSFHNKDILDGLFAKLGFDYDSSK